MSKPHTHRIVHNKTLVSESQAVEIAQLFRVIDGMLIATVRGLTVSFGEDPQRQGGKVFCDHQFALGFLRKFADRDWAIENGLDPMSPTFLKECANWAASIEEVDQSKRRLVVAT